MVQHGGGIEGVSSTRFLGAVLAGGASRRFGSDKALASLRGKSLLDHAVGSLAEYVDVVAVCGRLHPTLLSLPDRPRPGLGPLGGLNAALRYAQANGFRAVLTTGCDMPCFPEASVALLDGKGAVALEQQHLMGRWPASLAPVLDAYLASSTDRSVRGWLAVAGTRLVAATAPPPNVNTPEDLARLERELGGS